MVESLCCSAVSVTWNGTTITGPVLIYRDELPIDPNANTIGDPNGAGVLICRSEDSASISWHFIDGFIVRGPQFTDTFQAITTQGTPSLSQLLLNGAGTNELGSANLNGLWHCRLNARERVDEEVNVGIFSRGAGKVP